MLNAKLGEVFVVTREKLLVGTINIEAIAQEGKNGTDGISDIEGKAATGSGE